MYLKSSVWLLKISAIRLLLGASRLEGGQFQQHLQFSSILLSLLCHDMSEIRDVQMSQRSGVQSQEGPYCLRIARGKGED